MLLKGYIGKLNLDQSWLSKPTSDWSLDLGFCNQVDEFKVGKKMIDIALKIKYNELTFIRYIFIS